MILNRTYIFTFLCLLLLAENVTPQNKIIDSLKNKLKTHTQKDTIRVEVLNNLAFYHYRNYPDKALSYAEEAEKIAIEIKAVKGQGRSHYMRGAILMEQSKFKGSINHYNKAIELFKLINDQKRIAGCKNALGVLYYYKGNLKESLKNYEDALAIDQKLGIEKNMSNYLYNIGNILSDTGSHNKAIENFKKALEVYKKDENQHGILSCFNAMASLFVEQGNYPLGLEYHNKSLDVAKKSNDKLATFQSLNNIASIYRIQERYDKALSLYNSALTIENKSINTILTLAIKSNIAGIYLEKKDYEKALSMFKAVTKKSRELEDNNQLVKGLNGLGYSYTAIQKYSLAKKNFKEAISITKNNNMQFDLTEACIGLSRTYYFTEEYKLAKDCILKAHKLAVKFKFLKLEKDSYQLLSAINDKLEEYKEALLDFRKYKKLEDSIFSRKNIEKVAEIEYENKFKNQLSEAEKREEELTKTVEITSQDLDKSKHNILVGVIIFLVLLILLGSIIFYLKLRNERVKTHSVLVEQKLLRSQMTPHFIFNSLSVLQGMILDKEERKSVSYLSKFSRLLRIVLENSRNKTVLLSQELIAIENYLALQNLKNESYVYSIEVAANINTELFQIPPMLIQPFVENAIEHAFKNTIGEKIINIKLSYQHEELKCEIVDNGIGLHHKKEKSNANKNSLSTSITSERLEMLSKDFNTKGDLTVEDREKFNEKGTIVTMRIPYLLS